MGKYLRTEMIGCGTYGKVYKGYNADTGETVAIKRIRIFSEDEGVSGEIMREVSFLMELQHEHIVRLLDVQVHRKDDNLFEDEVNLILEYVDCDLDLFRQKNQTTARNPLTIKKFLHQILLGVAYCHSFKVIHRDLKPQNVLVNASGDAVKISDFGFARTVSAPLDTYTPRLGTFPYMAPEILFRVGRYSTRVDIWSVGCIFAEMVKGQTMFRVRWTMGDHLGDDRTHDQLAAIFRLMGTPDEETWPGVKSLYPEIVNWNQHPPKDLAGLFPSLEPAGIDLLSKLLCLDPSRRITAQEALQHAFFNGIGNVA